MKMSVTELIKNFYIFKYAKKMPKTICNFGNIKISKS